MKVNVKHVGHGILRGINGETFICDIDEWGHILREDTGEAYKASKRDENGDIVEVEEL